LVADIRIQEGQQSFPLTLLENPKHHAASQLRLRQFFDFDCITTTVTLVKAKDLWKYFKRKIRLAVE